MQPLIGPLSDIVSIFKFCARTCSSAGTTGGFRPKAAPGRVNTRRLLTSAQLMACVGSLAVNHHIQKNTKYRTGAAISTAPQAKAIKCQRLGNR
jgi:hypothetical protein